MKPNIATANRLTRCQESAVLIKLSELMGFDNIEEAVKVFLHRKVRIVISDTIKWISTISVPSTNGRFHAKDRFKLMKDGGICSYITAEFHNRFLLGEGKIEPPLDAQQLCHGILTKNLHERMVGEELGGETKAVVTLTEVFYLMSIQPTGKENGPMSPSMAKLFCVLDMHGITCIVEIFIDGGGWHIDAKSNTGNSGWREGNQIISRKP